MKKYYIICSIIAVVLFVVMLALVSIIFASQLGQSKKRVENAAQNTVVIRYYLSDDTDNAAVGYIRIEKNADFTIKETPSKEGYRFVAWFSGPNASSSIQYTDSNGNSLQTTNQDLLLYPIFEKEV